MSRTPAAEASVPDSREFEDALAEHAESLNPLELADADEVEGAGAAPSPSGREPTRSVRSGEPLTALSDQELLEGLRAESEPYFAELYNRYFQRIYNFVYARMRNHAETEEVVQETFLAVFRSIENYRGQSSLLS